MRLPTAILFVALAAGPCVAAAQPASVDPPEGKRLFDHRCGMCHNAVGMGTGLLARRVPPGQAELEKRQNLTAGLVTTVARRGLGNMPAITRGDVSDSEMKKIAAYLAREPAR